MENKEELFETVRKLRADCAVKQKKGLHFIVSSVIIWTLIVIIHASQLSISSKNSLTFICSAPLMGLAVLLAKPMHIDFKGKDNPLTTLGIFFSMNQVIYLLIAMWVCTAVPDKMLMVYTMIMGAHLLPFGWLYGSNTYLVLSVLIPVAALLIGLSFAPVVLAVFMLIIETVFSICLMYENKNLEKWIKANPDRYRLA